MKSTKIYLVCWAKGNFDKLTDHYTVFIDGTSKENKKAAKAFYKVLITKKKVFSANICKIIKSTDYGT